MARFMDLARRPDVTAILAVHDSNAFQALRALREMGVSVPEQVSVIGNGNISQIPEGLPGLTTIGFPAYKVGYTAAGVLYEHIQDPDLAFSRVSVQAWVIDQGSCAVPRQDQLLQL